MSTKRVTIKDVAAGAEVTAQTVSRVFRNKDYVSEATRDKVLEVAKQLNYIPNSAAVSLRTGKAKNIAVVFDSLMNMYFSIIVDYIHREVKRCGYHLQTIYVDAHLITEPIYRSAISAGASAVISLLEPEPSLGKVVGALGVPLCIVGRRAEAPEIDYITTDDEKGGAMVAERFLSCGCKTFVYAADAFGMTCVIDRLKGFRDTLAAHGFRTDVIDCTPGRERALLGYVGANGWPDAIFCFSDMIAYDILKSLRKYNITGTHIIGYDNIRSDFTILAPLTSVGVDKETYVQYVLSRVIGKAEGRITDRITEKVRPVLYEETV